MSTRIFHYNQKRVLEDAAKRRKVVVKMRHQGLSFGAIGRALQISRQRAQQIWVQAVKLNETG